MCLIDNKTLFYFTSKSIRIFFKIGKGWKNLIFACCHHKLIGYKTNLNQGYCKVENFAINVFKNMFWQHNFRLKQQKRSNMKK